MKLLLDTQVWVWSFLDEGRLNRRVLRELSAPRNELWLSPISVWEVVLLLEGGRLKAVGDSRRWLEQFLLANSFREAAFTHEVAIRGGDIRLPYRDPADRLLAASALTYDLTLVTADQELLDAKVCTMMSAR